MKKIIAVIVFSLLLTTFAVAETDLTQITNEDLISLYTQLMEEMEKRGISPVQERTLREGKYIIGDDIQPGSYTITCTETMGEKVSDAYGNMGEAFDSLADTQGMGSLFGALGGMMDDIGMTVEIIGDYGDVLKSINLRNGDTVDIKLEEKTAIKISDGSCILKSK